MSAPNRTGATAQSSYNAQEISDINSRLQAIEQLLELDTRFAGLNIQWKASRVVPSSQSNDQQETLASATPAMSPTVPLSILNAAANNVAATLVAPPADGLWKFVYPSSAAHTPSLDGTNVRGESGKVGTFGATSAWLVMHSMGAKWAIIASSGVTWA